MHRTPRHPYAPFLIMLCVAASASARGGEPPGPGAVLDRVDAQLGSQGVYLRQLPVGPEGGDKTLAPYLYVQDGDPETERLPLKGVSVDAQIAGLIARVRMQQTFQNDGKKPIEAVYVFPASTRAAVQAMRMKIGARTVEAKIERKQTAREQYEAAKAQGRRTSLLEQQRPNVFTMNVANLMPGDRIDVELEYSEVLVPEEAVYEFVLPTVVGPRYGGRADPKADRWIANPYLPEGSAEPFPYAIKVHLQTPIAIKELASPSHKVAIKFSSANAADVALDQPGGGNKDFILRYRLAGDRIESGVMLYPGDRESFFLMMMEPPQRPTAAQIPPREYVFVLDVSGSMWGFPLDTAKALMRRLLSSLRPSDYFNVVLFSGAFYVMSPQGSLPATRANIDRAIEVVGRQQGGGGTELMGALHAAYGVPKFRQGGGPSRSVVVVTDGYVGVEAQAFKFIREHLDEANLFAFGIGSAVNRALIEGMARAGQGEPFIVLKPEKAPNVAERFRHYVDSPVLANVRVRFDGFGAYDVAPRKLPDLMARRPIALFGKYRGSPTGSIRVEGNAAGGVLRETLAVGPHQARAENSSLRALWARKWIEVLDDERSMAPSSRELEEAITQLGLGYSLLTPFTSFVAVDSQVVNQGAQGTRVAQPLPLPEGVSNHAVAPGATAPGRPLGALTRGRGFGYAAPAPPAMERKVAAASLAAQERDDAKPQSPAPASLRVDSSVQHAEHIADRNALLRAVAEALRKRFPNEGARSFKLRLTVDASGRVTQIEWLSDRDAKLAARVRAALVGLRSAARAQGAPTGVLEIGVTFSR